MTAWNLIALRRTRNELEIILNSITQAVVELSLQFGSGRNSGFAIERPLPNAQ